MLGIRTDVNDTIATGHVMRCLAIADAVKALGGEVIFFLADGQGKCLIESRGFKTEILHTDWKEMGQELGGLESLIQKYGVKNLLIDSYQVTPCYLRRLTSVARTIYIDDIDAFHYPVNAIICYANYWEKFHHKERYPNCRILTGTKYVPLRQAFSDCPPKKVPQIAENLLLLSGGTDNFHILENLLKTIEKEDYRRIDVICGAYYSDYEKVLKEYGKFPNIYFHKAVPDIERYMGQADLAVSAGGTTLYELCAMGVPTITYSFADNQLDNVRQFHEDGIMDYAGDVRSEDIFTNVNRDLERCRRDRILRQERSEKMQMLVDGKGAKRIAAFLMEWDSV